jgi:hypothetical protein
MEELGMNALITLALASFASAIPAQPQWQNDYREARLMALEGKKPLAVFIGSGVSGWEKVSAEGDLDPKVNELLKEKYVCVYINTDTATGKSLAKGFAVAGKGLVISDKAGSTQAFYHDGELSKNLLEKALVRYADTAVAQGTETVAHLAAPAPAQYAPAQYYIIGGGCPGGNCGGGGCAGGRCGR